MSEDHCVVCGEAVPEGRQVCPSHIADSGARRAFETGAVRDIQEGKGRCDLLPMDIIAYITPNGHAHADYILLRIQEFKETADVTYLFIVLDGFNEMRWKNKNTMILELAKHFEEGAKKYGENNWQKGIPTHCYIDSAVRHYLKYLRGDTDEPHDRAFVWNIVCCIWTCARMPKLNDYGKKEGDN